MHFSVFIILFVSFGVCSYIHYFFDSMRNQALNRKYLLELKIKILLKDISPELVLNFNQRKTFFKKI